MRIAPGLYSRLVAVLKVFLPLVAVGMLASLFLIPREDPVGGGIVFSEGDTDALGQGLSVTRPSFSGTSETGDRLRFTAESLIPDAAPPNRAEIVGLTGTIDFAGGPEIALTASGGELDIAGRRIELSGEVGVETSDGYFLTAPRLAIDLKAGAIDASDLGDGDTVVTRGPLGRITSGSLHVEHAEAEGERRRFLFGNGVRLMYDPPPRGDAGP